MNFVAWSVVALVVTNLALAAGVLGLRLRNNVRARQWGRVEARWYPAMMDLLAGETTVEALLPYVQRREIRQVLEICGRMVRRVSGDDRRIVQDLARSLLHGLEPSLRSRSPEKRASAIQLLALLGSDDEFSIEISTALADPSPLVSMVAARVVARRRRTDLATEVLRQLDRFRMWSEAFLASMLASMGTEIAPDLRAHFAGDEHSSRARAVTARALAELRDVSSAEIAAGLLEDAPGDRALIVASLRVIETVGQTKHLGVVRPLLGHKDFVIRAHAATALGRIGTAADSGALSLAVADESPWVAIHAASALRHLGQFETLRKLSYAADASGEAALEALQYGGARS